MMSTQTKETQQPTLKELIQRAREKAFVLYEGKQVPHRSCGIALAETFGLPTRPYQALRRGGITGNGECGAIKAGELLLGEFLGDSDPTGAVTVSLREAMTHYQELWLQRLQLQRSPSYSPSSRPNIICNHLTGQFDDFLSEERQAFCTQIAANVAEIVAEILGKNGQLPEIKPIEENLKKK